MRIKFGLIELLFFVLITALCTMLLVQFNYRFNLSNWEFTEFLINYQGGFIRRGLIGEIIFQLINFGIVNNNPLLIIKVLTVSSFILLSCLVVTIFVRNNISVFILPMTFMLGFPISCFFWVRKDSIVLIILIISLYIIKKYQHKFLYIVCILVSISTLIHDSTLFIITPIITILVIFHFNFKNSISYLLIVITSLFVVLKSGTSEIVNDINSSWQKIGHIIKPQSLVERNIDNAVDALSWSLMYAVNYTANTFIFDKSGFFLVIHWGLLIVFVFILITNIHHSPNILVHNRTPNDTICSIEDKHILFLITLFQFICVIPLFILGIDYGRWIFLWSVSSLMIYFIQFDNLIPITDRVPNYIRYISTQYYTLFDNYFSKYPNAYIILCFSIGLTGFGVIGEDAIYTAPFYIVIDYVIMTFRTLYFIF